MLIAYSHGPRLIPTSSTSATVVEAAPSSRTNRIKNSFTPERESRAGESQSFGLRMGIWWEWAGATRLALLLDYTDDEEVALAEYKAFKTEVVSQLECTGPDGCWRLTGYEIDATLREIVDDPVAPSINQRSQRAINVRPHPAAS